MHNRKTAILHPLRLKLTIRKKKHNEFEPKYFKRRRIDSVSIT